jgi:hypothetical protein
MFTDSRPIPQPKWGYGVAHQYICRLQPPLRDIVRQQLGGWLMGTDLLRTFASHHIQPL